MDLTKYDSIRSQIKTGDYFEWAGSGLLSKSIALFTGGFSHGSLLLYLKEYEGKENRRFILEAESSGIVLTLASHRLSEYKGKVWWYSLKKEYESYRDKVAEWALSQVGTPYDFLSVFRNIFGYVSADARRMFCTEYVYLSYKNAGLPIPDVPAPRPGDMYDLGILNPPVEI
jgi:uncharacterized protein YycO